MIQKIVIDPTITLHVDIAGSGNNFIVLIHGLGGNLSFWAEQVRDLTKCFRVIRYDLRGHGKSSTSLDQSLQTHVKDLKLLLDQLSIDKAHIAGLSMGGLIAQTFASKFPDLVDKLVLVSTTAGFSAKGRREALLNLAEIADKQGIKVIAEQISPTSFASLPDEKSKMFTNAFCQQDQQSFIAACLELANADDLTPLLSSIQAKTLLCFGENDQRTPPICGEDLARKIKNARLKLFPQTGHLLPIEAPKEFNPVLLDFLCERKLI